jgi:hypothetical protein
MTTKHTEPSSVELLPCPFCGGSASSTESGHSGSCYFTQLALMKNDPPGDVSRASDVVAAWNRRSTPPAQPVQEVAQGWKLVPENATENQWGGLARDIVMWMDMHQGPSKTPRNLFIHLERLGRDVPQWLRDEPEMKNLDHVPSKGTRAVIIYRAMLAASPAAPEAAKAESVGKRAELIAHKVNCAYSYCKEKFGPDNVLTKDLADASNFIAALLSTDAKPVVDGELIDCPECGGQGYDADVTTDGIFKDTCPHCSGKGLIRPALLAATPAREWVGLTEEATYQAFMRCST